MIIIKKESNPELELKDKPERSKSIVSKEIKTYHVGIRCPKCETLINLTIEKGSNEK